MAKSPIVYTFENAAKAATRTHKEAGNLYSNLAGYAHSLIALASTDGVTHEQVRDAVKLCVESQEKAFDSVNKVKLGSIVAYRTAKSSILKAIAYGVSLVDEDGKARGKTDIEKETKELSTDKSVIEKFRVVHASMASLADKLLTELEMLEAMSLLSGTYNKLSEQLAGMKSRAADAEQPVSEA